MMDRVHSLLMGMHKMLHREHVGKMQRTVIWFKTGSQIIALPCSTNLLGGCLPMDLIKRCIDWDARFIPDEYFGF